jgi:hypothetical protein
VPRYQQVEGEVIHPDHAEKSRRGAATPLAEGWAAHGRVAKQAEGEAVEQAACWLLAKVCYRPTADAAVKVHTGVSLVTSLGAVARPAADVQAPAENKLRLWAVLARCLLEGAVLGLDNGGVELSVTWKDVSHIDDAPAPDEHAGAAGENGDVVAVVDVVAIDDGPPGQGEREVMGRVVAHTPISQQLVAPPGICYVAILVLALLWDGSHGLDHDMQWMTEEKGLEPPSTWSREVNTATMPVWL